MTKEQKTLILHYREQHMTYRQIGEKLGLSPDTVKTICRRKRAQSERTEESVQAQCRNCGAPVHLLPGRRERLFCSPACRTAYWRKHNLRDAPVLRRVRRAADRRERLQKVLRPRLLYPSSLWKHCVSVRGERKGNAFPSIGSRPDCSSDKQKADGIPSGGS